ncbi:MAG: polysaccharide deacetylase family protein [Thermodesulfobacteriota bacterium]|nr:polysaccharide deacetylase family protein [Thermodesulfobacteriota bacterium]
MNSIKHTLLKSILSVFKYTKIHWLLKPVYRGKGVILVLHRVLPVSTEARIGANSRIEITPQFLKDLILFFQKKRYDIISLDEMYNRISGDKKQCPFVCFTFDDGYADAHEIIQPIFKHYQCPYAVYIATAFPEGDITLWWYMLEDLVLNHENVAFTCQGKSYVFSTVQPKDKEQAYTDIRNLILNASKSQQPEVISSIFTPYGIKAENYADQQLNWNQIIELANDPLVTIGAHTVNHLKLNQLTADEAYKEIKNSKIRLEDKIGRQVHHFSYPFGGRNEAGKREFKIAHKCGFHTMTTVREGAIFPAHRHCCECLPRLEITGRHQDLTLVDMRLCGLVTLLRNGFSRVVSA